MMFFWLLLSVIVLVVIKQYWKNRKFYELAKEYPNDIKASPVLGHALYFLGSHKDLMDSLMLFGREAMKQRGMIAIWIGNYFSMHIADAEVADIITKNHLDKGKRFTKNSFAVFGNGLIAAPVPMWRQRRKKIVPTFSMKNLNTFVKIFDQQSRVMVERLRTIKPNESVSMWYYLTSYTFDAICESTLGVRMGAQKKKDNDFLQKIGLILSMAAERVLKPWLANDAIYKLLNYHSILYGYINDIQGYIQEIIQITRRKIENEKKYNCNEATENVHIKSFLERLLESGYTDLELKEETSVLVFAGTDTSAVGSSFAAVLLSRYPEIQENVYKELKQVIGENKPIDASDLPKLKYLEAVIKESMRLYPPVPVITRCIGQDITLPNGKRLLKDTNVMINIWAIHHNPKHWGPDVEEFKPERFLEEDTRHPCSYMPFSAGARNCVGFQYAMMSMKTNVATLLMHYKLTMPEELQHVDPKSPIPIKFEVMTRDENNFRVSLVPRIKNRIFLSS